MPPTATMNRPPATRHGKHARSEMEADPQADQAFDRWVDDMDEMLGELEGFFSQEQRSAHRRGGHHRSSGRAA